MAAAVHSPANRFALLEDKMKKKMCLPTAAILATGHAESIIISFGSTQPSIKHSASSLGESIIAIKLELDTQEEKTVKNPRQETPNLCCLHVVLHTNALGAPVDHTTYVGALQSWWDPLREVFMRRCERMPLHMFS